MHLEGFTIKFGTTQHQTAASAHGRHGSWTHQTCGFAVSSSTLASPRRRRDLAASFLEPPVEQFRAVGSAADRVENSQVDGARGRARTRPSVSPSPGLRLASELRRTTRARPAAPRGAGPRGARDASRPERGRAACSRCFFRTTPGGARVALAASSILCTAVFAALAAAQTHRSHGSNRWRQRFLRPQRAATSAPRGFFQQVEKHTVHDDVGTSPTPREQFKFVTRIRYAFKATPVSTRR